LVRSDALPDLPDDEAVLICTGSQGEPMAALSRIANRDHAIEVGPDDTIILASSLIPGNENAVNRVINGLTKQGATVVHKGNARVHVSGHASAGELLTLLNILQPRNVMPVHGEPRHLFANAHLAEMTGVPRDHIVIAENGSVVDLVDSHVAITGKTPVGFVYVDGASVGDITESELKDRRILGDEGFISVFVAVDITDAKVVAGPEVHERGFGADDAVFDEVIPEIAKALEQALADDVSESHQLQQIVRRTVGRWVSRTHNRRPMIVPVVVEV
jgi:ribonuclease J